MPEELKDKNIDELKKEIKQLKAEIKKLKEKKSAADIKRIERRKKPVLLVKATLSRGR